MAPACPRALAAPRGLLGPNRPASCSPDAGASRGTSGSVHLGPDRLLPRLEAVDRFALYGRQHAHVDHISGTQEDRSILLQSTILLQEDGLLAARLDDVTYLLDGLLASVRTQGGQARSVLELASLLQDPQILQAVELSSQRRRIQHRTRQLLLSRLAQDQDEETCRLALAVLVYVLSSRSEMHELLDDKVLDAVVLALKREVARESSAETRETQVVAAEEKQVGEDAVVPLKKKCLKRKQMPGKTPLKRSGETETGASAPTLAALVSDGSCQKLLGELLHDELFYVEGELRLSTADTLCAALHNLLRVDCSSVDSSADMNVAQRYQQRQDARTGGAAGDVFKLLRARKRQLVRNGGVDILVYGLANRLKILAQFLPSSMDEAIRWEFAHSLHRVSMLLCVFDQVTFLIVDVQQYISMRRTLFVLLLKIIRLLSELSWSDQSRERWESESTRMSLGVEVLLSALRVLINLTHHNVEAAKHLHALGGMQLLANSFSQLWSLVRSGTAGSHLQRAQTQGKWEFDACLLLLSVMVNSIEFSGENHAALSRASLPLRAVSGDDSDMISEAKVSACDLFAQFFLTKVESYVDLINLTENGSTNGALSIEEGSDDWSPEDVILGGCTSLLLGFLMKGSSANSAVILKSLPDNSPRLLLRALGVFVAFHSQIGALTPDVAKSVLYVEKVLKSYQRSGLGTIEYDLLSEIAENSVTSRDVNLAARSEETDIDEVFTVSVEDAEETKNTGVSSLPIRARQLKNVCSNIDDSDEDDLSPPAVRKVGVANVKSGTSIQNSQAFGMRTPTRTPPRSPCKQRPGAKYPMKTPPRTSEKSPLSDSRLSVTAVLPDGTLSSPVVARLLKRTRQLVDEFDAEFTKPSRFSSEKGSCDDSVSTVAITDAEETKNTGVSSSSIRARQLCSTIDDSDEGDISPSGVQNMEVASSVKSGVSIQSSQTFGIRTPTRIPPRSPGKKRPRAKKTPPQTSEKSLLRDSRLPVIAALPDSSLSSPVVTRLLKRTRQLVDEFDAGFTEPSRSSPEKRSGVSSEETVMTDSAPSPCVVLTMDVTCRNNDNDGLDVSQDVGKEIYVNVRSSKVCAEHNAQVGLSSKRRKKADANSKSATTYQETSFGFTPIDTPPSTPLRKKNSKVLLQTPTRNGRSPGNYRQSPSLKLTPMQTSPSTPLRIKKSAGLLRISSKKVQPPIMDQPPISANPHRRKMKGARAPSAPASSVFDFTD